MMGSSDASNGPVSNESSSSVVAAQSVRGWRLWLWQWFWRLTLVVSLGYAWYCFYVPANSIAWADSFPAAQQRAVESGKPMLMFFTGEWCVPCRIMKREVWADAEVTASVNKGFVPVAIYLDDPSAAETCSRYGVLGSPVTMITDPQGNVLHYESGGMNKAEFFELLGKLEQQP